ncbi:DNA polymerase III subunit gamma/tau [Pseudothermotoga hypogea DSM 11164 = NBRC 106472]|uniref:DNA polymerase III subunit gamma/tau n=1 Tax=Pseudothermotoga hypogea DSM 11164 = NBRC 106472 TaxID=1123384 RepID=A0A0X1KPK4_9THEM|nr:MULTISPECIES: DNA polymerase III subunit gamma/tau [Pseudothermotoga]AJC73183.1 DNA polymerase III subunit gamma/tau [Pseudothermotoga hypogea DSM 11164 = NBRC 106472]MDI6863467.1 DNA polymerase III subunit gamma/tau [Pseudothermotoga sp.]
MEALYRKYRPKSFSQVIDQVQAKLVLQNAILTDRVSHAYIFSGPRGSGKTTLARILAKALNCPNRKDFEPCCTCESCISIDKGNHPDVIELDAASNRGIDEIRRIRDAVMFKPMMGMYKVYIIDEFHMLTREAFNALLKTLEEPPERVVFVLATTNLERVPATIVSRCQLIEFRSFKENDILQQLKLVASKENIPAEEEALKIIAKRASGGMRDALTMLEQVSSYALSDRITVETVERALGLAPSGAVEEYLHALMNGDATKVGEIVDRMYEEGYDIEQFVQVCLERMEEEIASHPSTETISLARDLMNLASEMRFFENKRIACKLLSIDIAARRGTKVQPTQSAKEQAKSIEPIEQKDEAVKVQSDLSDQIDVSPLLDYLRNQGDMAMYVALVQANITKKDGTVEVSFLPSQRFQYEYLREKLFELEYLFKTQLKSNVTVELKVDEEREKQLLEKLQKLFPGRIKIEE